MRTSKTLTLIPVLSRCLMPTCYFFSMEYLQNTFSKLKYKIQLYGIKIIIIRYNFCNYKLPRKKDISVYVKIVRSLVTPLYQNENHQGESQTQTENHWPSRRKRICYAP